MKKMIIGIFCLSVVSVNLVGISTYAEESSYDTSQLYPEEAKEAGYSYEQYKDIMAIPILPSEEVIGNN